jgi:hypothetical protein
MKTKNVFSVVALAAASSLAAFNAGAVTSFAFDPAGVDGLSGAAVPGTATTFTQVFTVGSGDGVAISSLGVYGYDIVNNISVAIYNSDISGVTSGSSLASATFNSGSLGTSSGQYNYKNASLNLSSGTYALVTSYTGGPNTSGYYSGGSGDITVYSGPLLSLNNLYKSGSVNPKDNTAFGSGNMSFDAFVPVPEMGLFGVAGVGLLGLVYVGRGLVMKRQNVSA